MKQYELRKEGVIIEKIAFYYRNDNLKVDDLKKIKKVINFWCKNNNYRYVFYYDKKNQYKEFDSLKDDVLDKRYKKIIITNLKNISDNVEDRINFINFLEDNDCKLISINGVNPKEYKKFMTNLYKKVK